MTDHICPMCHGYGRFNEAMMRPSARLRGHGATMRIIRKRLRWTQHRMGRELGFSEGQIRHMETGRRPITRATASAYAELALRACIPTLAAVFDAA